MSQGVEIIRAQRNVLESPSVQQRLAAAREIEALLPQWEAISPGLGAYISFEYGTMALAFDSKLARQHLARAYAWIPHCPVVPLNLALSYGNMEATERAIICLEKAMKSLGLAPHMAVQEFSEEVESLYPSGPQPSPPPELYQYLRGELDVVGAEDDATQEYARLNEEALASMLALAESRDTKGVPIHPWSALANRTSMEILFPRLSACRPRSILELIGLAATYQFMNGNTTAARTLYTSILHLIEEKPEEAELLFPPDLAVPVTPRQEAISSFRLARLSSSPRILESMEAARKEIEFLETEMDAMLDPSKPFFIREAQTGRTFFGGTPNFAVYMVSMVPRLYSTLCHHGVGAHMFLSFTGH